MSMKPKGGKIAALHDLATQVRNKDHERAARRREGWPLCVFYFLPQTTRVCVSLSVSPALIG